MMNMQNKVVKLWGDQRAPRQRQVNRIETYALAYKERTGKWPTRTLLARETGVSGRSADNALRVVRAVEISGGGAPVIKYTKAQEQHIEARLRVLRKEQEAAFAERVRLAMLEKNKDYRAHLEEAEAEARRKDELYGQLINDFKPILTEEEYKTILICLHPDNSATVERRDTAFKAFTAVKLQLTGKR